MASYIVKVTQSEGQTRITIPKVMAGETGLDKAKVVEVWKTEEHIIHIKEYHGKEGKEGHI